MPLPKHTVQPVRVSQIPVPVNKFPNELEFVANATLCNLMHQMASISRLATNMFDELTAELSGLAERTMRLQNRLALLQTDVQTMEKGEEDFTTLPPVQLAPFCSKKPADSRVLSRNTIPPSMRACYERADPPPALSQMDELRDDSKISMKLYSDPDFFFDLWSHNMLQDARHKGISKRKRVKPRTKSSTGKRAQASNKPQMIIQQPGVGGSGGVSSTAPQVLQTPVHKMSATTERLVDGYAVDLPMPPTIDMTLANNSLSLPPLTASMTQSSVVLSQPVPIKNVDGRQVMPNTNFRKVEGPQLNGHPNANVHFPQSTVPAANTTQHSSSPLPPNLTMLNETECDIPYPHMTPSVPGDSQKSTASVESDFSHEFPLPPTPIFDNDVVGNSLSQTQFPGQNSTMSPSVVSSLPAPPPPPPPCAPLLPLSSSAEVEPLNNQMANLQIAKQTSKNMPDPRQDLLSAIRAGFQLRKVSEPQKSTTSGFGQHNSISSLSSKPADVQAIYEAVRRRRECLEGTSDDDDARSSSSGWSD